MQSEYLRENLCNDIRAVAFVKDKINEYFGDDMMLFSENVYLQHHGWFMLKFIYKPKNYLISFESEFGIFCIYIESVEGGSTSLNQITRPFENSMISGKIENAIWLLRRRLRKEIEFRVIKTDRKKEDLWF